jgi:hypothetical protein
VHQKPSAFHPLLLFLCGSDLHPQNNKDADYAEDAESSERRKPSAFSAFIRVCCCYSTHISPHKNKKDAESAEDADSRVHQDPPAFSAFIRVWFFFKHQTPARNSGLDTVG